MGAMTTATPPEPSTDVGTRPDAGTATPFPRALPWLMIVAGVVGLVASFVLTVEKFALAADATYVPSCSIDAVVNCGSVMGSAQSAVFGFPNSLLGIIGFTAVLASGAALLSGARFGRWYWAGLQVGLTAAVVFVHWLMFQSLYVIGALCPYCMAVWVSTVTVFWFVTLRTLHHGVFSRPVSARALTAPVNAVVPPVAWLVAVGALVFYRFGAFWA